MTIDTYVYPHWFIRLPKSTLIPLRVRLHIPKFGDAHTLLIALQEMPHRPWEGDIVFFASRDAVIFCKRCAVALRDARNCRMSYEIFGNRWARLLRRENSCIFKFWYMLHCCAMFIFTIWMLIEQQKDVEVSTSFFSSSKKSDWFFYTYSDREREREREREKERIHYYSAQETNQSLSIFVFNDKRVLVRSEQTKVRVFEVWKHIRGCGCLEHVGVGRRKILNSYSYPPVSPHTYVHTLSFVVSLKFFIYYVLSNISRCIVKILLYFSFCSLSFGFLIDQLIVSLKKS
jgi:hypothetical protein